MTIMSEDGEVIVGIGGSTILHATYSTAICRINFAKIKIRDALDFLKTGTCARNRVKKTLEQMKIIKAEFIGLAPNEAVFDCDNVNVEVPWKGNISDEVCSCMDLFTTDDGRLLIDELIALLEYSEMNGLSVVQP